MSRVPRIRFKGFEEDWEQRKLGEIFKYEQPQAYIVKSTEYNDTNEIPVLTAGQSFILGFTDEEFGIKEVSENNPVIIFDDFTTSSHYVDFSFKVKSSAMKLLTLNNQKDNMNCTFNALQGVAYVPISHERHWISTFAKFDVLLPKSDDEQELIGDFFVIIDRFITLHQRKLGKLKIIKKSMLENLFPENGEKTPRIRFSGFTEDWEQRKLGEVAAFSKGCGYSKSDLKDSGIPVILYGRLYTNYETVIKEVDTFVDCIGGAVYSKGGEIITPSSGETSEDISIASVVEKSGILLGGDLNIIYPQNLLDSIFIAISISNGKPHKDMAKRAQGKSVVHLHNGDLAQIEIDYPSIDEQTRISSYFQSLDHLITLHQSKLEKLQKIKKSMLESMFV